MADLSGYSDIDIINIVSSDAETELKKRGYDYGWYKKEPYIGAIYIMVNPAFKELVKIGYADDVAKRMKSLNNNSGLPDPFHCYALYKVKKRLEDLKLHGLIDSLDSSLRHSQNREFYEMDAEKAYSILSAIAQISGDEEQLVLNPFNDDYFMKNEQIKILNGQKSVVNVDVDNKVNSFKQLRYDYWKSYNDYVSKNQRFTSSFKIKKPSFDSWKDYAIGVSDCHIVLNLFVPQNKYSVEIYISNNKNLYYSFLQNKSFIESECGLTFDWRELPNRAASRIVVQKSVAFYDRSKWYEQFDWLIDVMIRIKEVFKKYYFTFSNSGD